jgi:hypothetical protein
MARYLTFLAIIEPNWVGAIPWGRFHNIKLCNSRSSERRRWVRLTTFVRAEERRLSNMLYLASIWVIPIIVAVTFYEAAHGPLHPTDAECANGGRCQHCLAVHTLD